MLLLLDNYDSFTYNLAQYFGELGFELSIARNDAITIAEIAALMPSHICISFVWGTNASRKRTAGKWCLLRVSCMENRHSSIMTTPRYCRICRCRLRQVGITRSLLNPIHFPRASKSSRKLMGTRSWRSAIANSLCMVCNFIPSRSLHGMARKSCPTFSGSKGR